MALRISKSFGNYVNVFGIQRVSKGSPVAGVLKYQLYSAIAYFNKTLLGWVSSSGELRIVKVRDGEAPQVLLMKSKFLMGLTIATMLGCASFAQAPAAKNWKDRAEYDLAQEIDKAKGDKKLELLDQWKQKYPESDFKVDRIGIYVATYQAMSKPKEMLAASRELVAVDPKNLTIVYYICSLVPVVTPTDFDAIEKAANQLNALIPEAFEAKNKPAAVTDAAWVQQKAATQDHVWTTRYIAVKGRKNPVGTEEFLKSWLGYNPNNAQASYDLGTAILQQKKADRQPEALWQFSRAASLSGPGSFADAQKKQIDAYIRKIYPQYQGSVNGLDKLLADSAAAPFPPTGFKITTELEKMIAEEEELKKTNPQLALWIAVKKALVATDGEDYFKSSVLDAGVPKMKGKVLSHTPALKPKEIVVAVADATTPEITIKIADGGFLPGKADPGTEIEFEGTAKAFTKAPFMLTVEVEKEQLNGWPVAAPVTPKKATGGAKKAVGKKK